MSSGMFAVSSQTIEEKTSDQRLSWTSQVSSPVPSTLGAGAADIGHWIAETIGVASTSGIDWIELIIQIGLAMVVIGVVGGVGSRRT